MGAGPGARDPAGPHGERSTFRPDRPRVVADDEALPVPRPAVPATRRPDEPPEDLLPSRLERGCAVHWSLTGDRPVRSLVQGVRTAAPDVVLVPGLGALGYLLPAVRACAAWTRVQLLDLPGFGHRTTARLPADLDAVSAALAAWLAEVPDRPVVLVGHSTGAQSALRAALVAPEAVGLLVLGGVTFPPHLRSLPALAAPVAATLPHERTAEVPAVLPYYGRGARRLPQLLRSALDDRPEDAVSRLAPPLLVLRGEHDHLCPQPWAADLAARAPAGRLQELPGGHNFPWTAPTDTSSALRVAAAEVRT